MSNYYGWEESITDLIKHIAEHTAENNLDEIEISIPLSNRGLLNIRVKA